MSDRVSRGRPPSSLHNFDPNATTNTMWSPRFVLATSPEPPKPASTKDLSKSVIFATSGIGGILGWVIVHPANT